jgi:hypothetical protein
MSIITTKDLREIARFNTDMLVGWETQIAYRRTKIGVVWPEHFKGKRVTDFRHGSWLARMWMAQRRGVGMARRQMTAEEIKLVGGSTPRGPFNRAELREEQVATLREVVRIHGRLGI